MGAILIMRFLRTFVMACLAGALLHACASTSNGISADRMAAIDQMQNSVDYIELDAEIEILENETHQILSDYEEVEHQVLSQLDFKVETRSDDAPILATVTSNNVLLIDGNAMSRHDFSVFANKNLPDRCKITPELQIDDNADFETAAWILETFYSHGCVDVKIVE
jgi:hypothetical protein